MQKPPQAGACDRYGCEGQAAAFLLFPCGARVTNELVFEFGVVGHRSGERHDEPAVVF